MELNEGIARKFAAIALGHVTVEYPNKLDHVMASDQDAATPRDLHPAFFGSFDWHSCVHSWWLLLTLRRLYPQMPEASQIDALAEETFSDANMATELAYIRRPQSKGFERPYGWAWLLALHKEASRHSDREWGGKLEPLALEFAERFKEYLPLLTYPITVGTHFNTAFALVLARGWAQHRDHDLLRLIDKWSLQTFGNRADYSGWEPGGDEFLSPVMVTSLLMSLVLPGGEFSEWFDRLALRNGWVENACRPVSVSDRSDGKIAHLDGLNLSRAWCLRGIGRAMGSAAPPLLEERASEHLEAALPHVAGDYMGEHWLASFALLALLARSQSA